jgi:hypothetical protein
MRRWEGNTEMRVEVTDCIYVPVRAVMNSVVLHKMQGRS